MHTVVHGSGGKITVTGTVDEEYLKTLTFTFEAAEIKAK